MKCSTVPFGQAHAALVAAGPGLDLATITTILEPIKSDLQQLLASPPKSDQSRAVLAKKVVEIDGDEIELNDAFLNDAARVADELNLDEIVAARLVFYAIEDSKRLRVSAVESALTLYYVRRQYILDIVRFGLESLPEANLDLVLGAEPKRLDLIVDALKAVERSMADLDEKLKTGEFMGLAKNAEFSQIIALQRAFLVKEHEALGSILYNYFEVAAPKENRGNSLLSLLNHLATFEILDSRILSYFPALSVWFSAPHNEEFTKSLWSYFTSASTARWKQPCWQAGLALVAYTALADEERALPPSIAYASVLDAVRHAIDEGALEFWMSLASDVNSSLGHTYFERFDSLVRLRVPKLTFWQAVPSRASLDSLQQTLESLATKFITNLADILKEMRLSEEDMYLAMNELEEDAQAVSPGVDLERFFLFVAITFQNYPDSSRLFFEDEGDALYGFLTWAADCQVTFMAATFTELVAALANDAETCKNVHEFLENGTKRAVQGDDGFMLTWSSIYDVIEYYIRGMSSPQAVPGAAIPSSAQVADDFAMPGLVSLSSAHPQAPAQQPAASLNSATAPPTVAAGSESFPAGTSSLPPSSSAPQWGPQPSASAPQAMLPPQQQAQLSDDTILVLSAYLHLMARVAIHPAAEQYLRGKSTTSVDPADRRDIVPLLFKLLKLKQPITGSILAALVPFVNEDMWPMLDGFILGKFDEVLQSLQDAIAFGSFFEKLVENCEVNTSHLGEYIDFVLKTVLPWTTSSSDVHKVEDERALKTTKTLLQLHSLGMLKALLSKTPYNELAFRACFNANVYEPLLEVLTTGIDHVNDLDASHPLAQTVTRGVEVVSILMELSSPSWSFDKPVLYRLQVVPHLALYAGSLLRDLSLASIKLLSLLDESPEFKPTINRQSRILSILSSTTEATRIRVGLMSRLEDNAADISVKVAILELIASQLRTYGSSKQYMTVAHYLLGLRQSELGLDLKLELDSGVGGISSGSSLLSAICDTLLQSLLSAHKGDIRVLRLCSEILWRLIEDPLTSEMLLDYLRQFDYWLNTIKCEYASGAVSEHFEDIMAYRATMLEIWIVELNLCQRRLLLTIEGHYLEALVPMVFNLIDLSQLPKTQSSLKCLNAWCKLIPALIASGDARTGPTFIARIIQMLVIRLPEYSRENAEFAVPLASLLVFLFNKYQQKGSDDSVARHMHMLFEAALLSLQPAQVNSKLRSDLYSICFQNLKLVLEKGTEETEAEALSVLSSGGHRTFHIACDDILGHPNENLRLGALLFVQLSAALSGQLNSKLVSTALLQYNFVSVLIQQILGPLLASGHGSHAHNGSNVPSGVNSHDSLSRSGAESRAGFDEVAHSGSSAARSDDVQTKTQFLKIAFSLLRHIAQSRDGASNVLGSGMLRLLDPVFPDLDDDLLLLTVQLLIAIVVSMGPENSVVLHEVRGLLSRHASITDNVLRRDAALSHALQNQTSESGVSYLARNFTILMSLTSTGA